MRPSARGFALLLVALAACSGDSSGPSGGTPLPTELVGTWQTNAACAPRGCRLVARSATNPSDSLAVLNPPLQFSARLTLQANGAATASVTAAGLPAADRTGSAKVANGLLIVSYPGSVADTASFSVSGNLLTLDYHNRIENLVDLNGDHVNDTVTLHGTFERQ